MGREPATFVRSTRVSPSPAVRVIHQAAADRAAPEHRVIGPVELAHATCQAVLKHLVGRHLS
jgi:hypothetical protein